MTQELVVLLDQQEVGRVRRNPGGKLSFIYDEGWRFLAAAYPISLSMPLSSAEHGHARIDAFLWGLLPDNQRILEQWASRFHVSAKNAFGLIAAVGEDCAGAIQFVRPERLEQVTRGKARATQVQWLDERGVADRLRALERDPAIWRMAGDSGQFSLAGAQAKTALLFDPSRGSKGTWAVPSGRLPTTHILKPPLRDFDGHVENEHFCLRLARSFGLPVPHSEVMRFEDQVAIVVERYDRIRMQGVLRRIHQEDLCQALGLSPTKKYENEGGPGVRRIVDLLRTFSGDPGEDVAAFIDSLVFNWLIAGTDAHAKNYSLLLGTAGAVRLAPLYDLASVLPYKHMDPLKVKLAMKIGGVYRMRDIRARQWERLAGELKLDVQQVLTRVRSLAKAMADHVSDVQRQVVAADLIHPVIGRLAQRLIDRSRHCLRVVSSPAGL
ncbi:MAG: type II toxin-antitoxin system HipA family toxin [Acidobacteriia bacterium]|nr:type II toxin-antitoxin system HipA family toxin [Terriglobia bacterium]